MLKDRTNEFHAIVESIHSRKPGLDNVRLLSTSSTARLSKSEFARAASAVGREISTTAAKLSRLAALAKKKSLFDDRPVEINELIHVIKQDIGKVSNQISGLQKYLDGAKKGHNTSASRDNGGSSNSNGHVNGNQPILGANNKQVEEHSDLVIKSLQSRLANTSHEFKGILEIRSQNMVEQKDRRAQYSFSPAPVAGSTGGGNSNSIQRPNGDSSLYHPDQLRQRAPISNQNDGNKDSDIVIDFSSLPPTNVQQSSQQQSQLVYNNVTHEYIESRSQAIESIESTIAELGQIYQNFATILAGQREMVQRIDDNVQDVEMNVEGAHGQLMKYYTSISSNSSASGRLIAAKDHAAVQINIGDVDASGRLTGTAKTYAVCGFIRSMGESDDSINRLATTDGYLRKLLSVKIARNKEKPDVNFMQGLDVSTLERFDEEELQSVKLLTTHIFAISTTHASRHVSLPIEPALCLVCISIKEHIVIFATFRVAVVIGVNDRLTPRSPTIYKMSNWTIESLPYKELVLGFSFALWGFESILNWRQYKVLQIKEAPKAYAHLTSVENYEKARRYSLAKLNFGIISSIWSQCETVLIFYYDLLPWFWTASKNILSTISPSWADNEILQSLIFVTVTNLASTITNLPFSLYFTFVIEEHYGFNKQTLALFFSDLVKSLALGAFIGFPVIAAVLYIVQIFENFHVYLWLFVMVFQLVMVTIYPTFIQPLFNKFDPLPEGELKDKIDALAKTVKFPLKKMFIIDGSRRSAHSNAYLYGFFNNKQLVLFDTLLEQTSHEETLAVVAHEIGHWHHSHTLQNLIIAQAHLFILFWLFGQAIHFGPLYTSFKFTTHPILIGFMLFQFIYSPAEALMGFIMNVLSRAFEFQADLYAVTLGHAAKLKTGLQKIHLKNLGSLRTDSYYSAWHYSHPPLVERLEAITKAATKSKKKE
ncbi:Ste24 endopeptidase [Synchytrium microbalum]|uniref:Ste24 endopeptidase n=1 Tax=Synchytrium microbalum TaxID=1806994 RepID=A0A507CCT0_9FUNG|nr:Ste24 endopeptidase [Synchytrium microbalum]TPX35365.1 Ste24 endopeptidase [Synchytrium microbalum]